MHDAPRIPDDAPAVELFVFDMDGVLADTEPLHLEATNGALAADGLKVEPATMAGFLGNTDADAFTVLKERHALPRDVAAYVAEKDRHLERLLAAGALLPNEGVCELLVQLKMRGIPAVVASSSAPFVIERIVGTLGLRRAFQGLYSAAAVGRGKPAPDLFLHAAACSNVAPEACLVIEDAPAGIAAARAAGMRCVAVRTAWTTDADLAAADIVLESLAAFDAALLERFRGG